MQKRWSLYPQYNQTSQKLAQTLNIHPLTAQVLLNRKITSINEATHFLGRSTIPNSVQFHAKDLQTTCQVVYDAIAAKKKILLIGDYDVDGMTSTALTQSVLQQLGADVRTFIPNRFIDGYGLSQRGLDLVKTEGIGLVMTLDCGVTNVKEITIIKQQTQAKVLVFDHHTLPEVLPPFDGMLNPKTLPETHPFYPLCTVGVMYQFFVAYLAQNPHDIALEQYLDLVALGTVADIATLQGINRDMTREGLKRLSQRERLGIKCLLETAACEKPILNTRDIGFVIAPRLNAAGRLSDARLGFELLLETNPQKAQKRAQQLEKLNHERRQLDQQMLSDANALVEEEGQMDEQIIVLASRHWHPGVIGITAAKLAETWSRPTVLIAMDEHLGRASARSAGTVNLYSILNTQKEMYEAFGGHKQAAGFSIKPARIAAFKTALQQSAKTSIKESELRPIIYIDHEIDTTTIALSLIKELASLEPFGEGNPEPIFFSKNLVPVDFKTVGDGTHLKAVFTNQDENCRLDAIGFRLSHKLEQLHQQKPSLAFRLNVNEWKGVKKPQLELIDIK